jgi:hypothetical protein
MKRAALFLLLATACSAATEAPITVLAGAYSVVSINGDRLPVTTEPTADGAKQEIIAEHLWLGGSAGYNGATRRVVYRTTSGSVTRIDSSTTTGTFYPTLATAQTSFGPVSAAGSLLTLKALDGTTRIFARVGE